MPCTRRSLGLVAALAMAAGLALPALTASAQVGTAITYQGVLERSGQKVNSATDMRFTLFDAPTGGNTVGNQVTLDAQQVSNGLFNVALDFGVNPYTGDAGRWMQIEVRNPAGTGNFSPMGGRQKLTPAPFSLATRGINVNDAGYANVGLSGSIGDFTVGNHDPNDFNATLAIKQATAPTGWAFKSASDGRLFLDTIGNSNFTMLTLSPVSTGRLGISTFSPLSQYPANWIGLDASNRDISAGWGILQTGGYEGGRLVLQRGFNIANRHQFAIDNVDNSAKFFWLNDNLSGNTPAITIDANSCVGINTAPTNANIKLEVAGDMKITTGNRFWFGAPGEGTDSIYFARTNDAVNNSTLRLIIGDDPAASFDTFDIARDGNVTLFSFQSTGNAFKPGGGSWSALSDARAKHDIQPLGPTLDKVLKLQGKTFYYNDPKAKGAIDGQCTGFIAQEVETVFPEWVSEMADGYKTVSIRGFEALTVESLRELRAEKDAQIAERDAKIADLTARLEKLEALLGQNK